LSSNELCIVLYPDKLVMLCATSRLTPRGFKRYVHAQAEIPGEECGETDMPWSGAIRTLAKSLPLLTRRGMKATVILSNHFVHYVLVPWCDKLGGEKEEMTYVRHCFEEVYGDDAAGWELRLSPDRAGVPAFASGVDSRLLGELRELLGSSGVNISSIQPHLMIAHNICQASLRGRSTWLALLEPDNLCLAMLQQGQWSWMRKMRIGKAWREELPTILEREEFMAGEGEALSEVLLWAPHLHNSEELDDRDIPASRRWKFKHLEDSWKYGFGQESGAPSGNAAWA
jgi:hypothetical protein